MVRGRHFVDDVRRLDSRALCNHHSHANGETFLLLKSQRCEVDTSSAIRECGNLPLRETGGLNGVPTRIRAEKFMGGEGCWLGEAGGVPRTRAARDASPIASAATPPPLHPPPTPGRHPHSHETLRQPTPSPSQYPDRHYPLTMPCECPAPAPHPNPTPPPSHVHATRGSAATP